MKRLKNILIMAGVLALLVAVYLIWGAVGDGGNSDESMAPADESHDVAGIVISDLTAIDITVTKTESADDTDTTVDAGTDGTDTTSVGGNKAGTVVRKMSFSLNSGATAWLWSDDESVPLDNQKFATMITALNDATSPYRLDSVDASALSEYGLASPYISITFTVGDAKTTYRIGNLNTFNGMYYLADEADLSVVLMVDKAVPEAFDIGIFDLILFDDMPSFTATGLTSLTYTKGSDKLVYTYYPNGNDKDYTNGYQWYLSVNGGKEYAVAVSVAESLTNAVVYMDFDSCVSYDKAQEANFGLDAPGCLVIDYKVTETVTDQSTSASTEVTTPAKYVLYFGSDDGDGHFYVRPDNSDLVYTLSYSTPYSTLFAAKDNAEKIRPQELILPDYDAIDSVKLTAGARTLDVALTHAESGTTYSDASGATLNYELFQKVISTLSELKADSYASYLDPEPSAGTDVIFTASFTFNRGDSTTGELTVRRYSEKYCLVSFMGRADQLITLEAAQTLVSALEDYFS